MPGLAPNGADQLLHTNEYYPVQPVQPGFTYWSHEQSHAYYPNSFQYPSWDDHQPPMSHGTQPVRENERSI